MLLNGLRYRRVWPGSYRRAPGAHESFLCFTCHHCDADSTVRRAQGVGDLKQAAGSQPNHSRQFVVWHAGGNQLTPRSVGSVGGEFPVAVASFGVALRRAVSMTIQADFVLNAIQGRADFSQYVAHIGFYHGTSTVEHGAFLIINDLNLKSIRCCIQSNL